MTGLALGHRQGLLARWPQNCKCDNPWQRVFTKASWQVARVAPHGGAWFPKLFQSAPVGDHLEACGNLIHLCGEVLSSCGSSLGRGGPIDETSWSANQSGKSHTVMGLLFPGQPGEWEGNLDTMEVSGKRLPCVPSQPSWLLLVAVEERSPM